MEVIGVEGCGRVYVAFDKQAQPFALDRGKLVRVWVIHAPMVTDCAI